MTGQPETPATRGRPCGARREGNVLPVTSLDRHTGRVAPATSELPLSPKNTNATAAATVGEPQHPAGSRDLNWRSSPANQAVLAVADIDASPPAGSPLTGAFFPRYSQTKCSSQARVTARDVWLGEVEMLTRAHRHERAMRHRGKARHASNIGDNGRASWHRVRAGGQVDRFSRVRACGREELVLHCNGCGHDHKLAVLACGHIRLCDSCRGARGNRYRSMVRSARRAILRSKSPA
jgi:hypothetical protein